MRFLILSIFIISEILLIRINCFEANNDKNVGNFENFSINDEAPSPRWAPCPDAIDIAPCTCTYDDEVSRMDCSGVEYDSELRQVFDQTSYDFYELNIENNPHLLALYSGVFGNTTFVYINFDHVEHFEHIDSDVLEHMNGVLRRATFSHGHLTNFDFDFSNFIDLIHIFLEYNHLRSVRIISPTLTDLHVSNNKLNNDNFTIDAKYLVNFFAPINEFEELPSMAQYENLRTVHFSQNPISNLDVDALCHSDSLTNVYLGTTGISDGLANICVMNGSQVVSLTNNNITIVDQFEFEPLVQNLISDGLHISSNSLQCDDCGFAWIFENNYIDKILDDARCVDGTFLHNKTLSDYAGC